MKIFHDSLGVVGDDKPISSEKLSMPLSMDIIAHASMNNITDVVQKENSLV